MDKEPKLMRSATVFFDTDDKILRVFWVYHSRMIAVRNKRLVKGVNLIYHGRCELIGIEIENVESLVKSESFSAIKEVKK